MQSDSHGAIFFLSPKPEDFVGAWFHCPRVLADAYQCIRIGEKTPEFSSSVLSRLRLMSPYLVLSPEFETEFQREKYPSVGDNTEFSCNIELGKSKETSRRSVC